MHVYVCVRAEAAAEVLPLSVAMLEPGNIRLAQEKHSLNSNAPLVCQIYKASSPAQQPPISLLSPPPSLSHDLPSLYLISLSYFPHLCSHCPLSVPLLLFNFE